MFSPYHIKSTLEQMRDVAFYFRKTTGITNLKDSSTADVHLGQEGLNVRHLSQLQA